MKKNESVSTIMTSHVYSVNVNDSLRSVNDLISKHKIRHVPVVKGKKLVGIISRSDVDRLTFSDLYDEQEDADDAVFEMLNISQVMTHKPTVVKKSDSIKAVAELFANSEFHALPVVNDKDPSKMEGIVTTTDIIRYMLKNL